MQKEPTYYRNLFSDFINDRLTPEKLDEWLDYVRDNPQDYAALLALPEIKALLEQRADDENITIDEAISARVRQRLMEAVSRGESQVIPNIQKVHFLRTSIFRWMAAASLVFLVGTGVYFLFFSQVTEVNNSVPEAVVQDVAAPATNRAMITLADGSRVFLDSAENGQLAQQGNITLVKLANGQIAYQTDAGELVREVQYNTLSNPKGSKVIDMMLADGSRVWLNAGSSITYPIAFVGNERKVQMIGEAYFEVTHNASQPFYVTKGDVDVQVLGTQFNLNAYDDESDIKVTLLEGAVKVNSNRGSAMLTPGQQARLTLGLKPETINGVDLEQVMAWKNGLFRFDKTGIQEVMRQISRWYDVEVAYPQGVPATKYWGSIRRDQSLAEVFRVLQESGAHFRIEGKKVVVLP